MDVIAHHCRTQGMAFGIGCGFFLSHAPHCDQIRKYGCHGMIRIQAAQLSIAEQPQRGIAHTDPLQPALRNDSRDRSGAHAIQFGVGINGRSKGIIGCLETRTQAVSYQPGCVGIGLNKCFDNRAAGRIAADLPAHPIGDHQHFITTGITAFNQAVIVLLIFPSTGNLPCSESSF